VGVVDLCRVQVVPWWDGCLPVRELPGEPLAERHPLILHDVDARPGVRAHLMMRSVAGLLIYSGKRLDRVVRDN
jgi:hypothetical protein